MDANNRKIYAVVVGVLALALLLGIGFWLWGTEPEPEPVVEEPEVVVDDPRIGSMGTSVEGRALESYTYGTGANKIMFVGGIHGGYEWNSVYLMHRLIDYLEENKDVIPENVELTIVPVMNPDGLHKIVGTAGRFDPADTPSVQATRPGRFNANQVDLNRNFDCNWQATSTWQSQEVSAGSEVFSEPEARAIRDWVLEHKPKTVIFWHSASDAVYASACNGDVLPETRDIMNVYADASGYKTFDSFDHYEITGDAGDWLASIGISSIAIEMKTHETIEWQKELRGIKALLEYYR